MELSVSRYSWVVLFAVCWITLTLLVETFWHFLELAGIFDFCFQVLGTSPRGFIFGEGFLPYSWEEGTVVYQYDVLFGPSVNHVHRCINRLDGCKCGTYCLRDMQLSALAFDWINALMNAQEKSPWRP